MPSEVEINEYEPIGGWLILLIIGLSLSACTCLYMSYVFLKILIYTQLDFSLGSFKFLFFGGKYITVLLLSILCLYLNYYYLSMFRLSVIALYIITAILHTFEVLFLNGPSQIQQNDIGVLLIAISWLPTIIWTPYLLFGRRVKRTYVYSFANNPWLNKRQ